MKSSVSRKIEIRHPKLLNLRNNLRTIIKKAYLSEFYRLTNIYRLYQQKRSDKKLTASQEKRSNYLCKKSDQLSQAFHKSICHCSFGALCVSYQDLKEKGLIKPPEKPINLNMVWEPHFKKWVCTNCYEAYCKIKICEICWETDERMDEIFECALCERYTCELCRIFCPGCNHFYCENCFSKHLENNKCGSFKIPDNYKIFFEEH